jgi:peptidoglycan/LPS O-acetylase OafA/YrhL
MGRWSPAEIRAAALMTIAIGLWVTDFLHHIPAPMIGLSPMPRLPGFGTGDYSYGLYLYHTPFLQLLIHYFPEARTSDLWWMLFFAGFAISLTAAVISRS